MALWDRFKGGTPPSPSKPPSSPTQEATNRPQTPVPADWRKTQSVTLPESVRAEATKAGQVVHQAGQHVQAQNPTNAPDAGGGGGNAAYRQNQSNQDKVQSAGSPTDRLKGKTVQSEGVESPAPRSSPPPPPAPASSPTSPSAAPARPPSPPRGRGPSR